MDGGTLNPGLVTVQASDGTTCGCITWWALGGMLDIEDLADAVDAEGLDRAHLPSVVTAETALHRAVMSCADKRTLVRPLDRRGMWEVLAESISEDEHGAPRLAHTHECRVELRPDETPLITPEDHRFAAKIKADYKIFRQSLISTDVSHWLTETVRLCRGVGLRDRGGMYFVPATNLALWRQAARVLRACSRNVVYEVPALKTDEAVEAILTAVRTEAEAELVDLENYLERPNDKMSTKGLNAAARKAGAVRNKLEHYAALLGMALPDMTARAETLAGAIQAAKLVERSEGGKQ